MMRQASLQRQCRRPVTCGVACLAIALLLHGVTANLQAVSITVDVAKEQLGMPKLVSDGLGGRHLSAVEESVSSPPIYVQQPPSPPPAINYEDPPAPAAAPTYTDSSPPPSSPPPPSYIFSDPPPPPSISPPSPPSTQPPSTQPPSTRPPPVVSSPPPDGSSPPIYVSFPPPTPSPPGSSAPPPTYIESSPPASSPPPPSYLIDSPPPPVSSPPPIFSPPPVSSPPRVSSPPPVVYSPPPVSISPPPVVISSSPPPPNSTSSYPPIGILSPPPPSGGPQGPQIIIIIIIQIIITFDGIDYTYFVSDPSLVGVFNDLYKQALANNPIFVQYGIGLDKIDNAFSAGSLNVHTKLGPWTVGEEEANDATMRALQGDLLGKFGDDFRNRFGIKGATLTSAPQVVTPTEDPTLVDPSVGGAATTTDKSGSSDGGLPVGVIVAIAVGTAMLVGLAALALFAAAKRRRRANAVTDSGMTEVTNLDGTTTAAAAPERSLSRSSSQRQTPVWAVRRPTSARHSTAGATSPVGSAPHSRMPSNSGALSQQGSAVPQIADLPAMEIAAEHAAAVSSPMPRPSSRASIRRAGRIAPEGSGAGTPVRSSEAGGVPQQQFAMAAPPITTTWRRAGDFGGDTGTSPARTSATGEIQSPAAVGSGSKRISRTGVPIEFQRPGTEILEGSVHSDSEYEDIDDGRPSAPGGARAGAFNLRLPLPPMFSNAASSKVLPAPPRASEAGTTVVSAPVAKIRRVQQRGDEPNAVTVITAGTEIRDETAAERDMYASGMRWQPRRSSPGGAAATDDEDADEPTPFLPHLILEKTEVEAHGKMQAEEDSEPEDGDEAPANGRANSASMKKLRATPRPSSTGGQSARASVAGALAGAAAAGASRPASARPSEVGALAGGRPPRAPSMPRGQGVDASDALFGLGSNTSTPMKRGSEAGVPFFGAAGGRSQRRSETGLYTPRGGPTPHSARASESGGIREAWSPRASIVGEDEEMLPLPPLAQPASRGPSRPGTAQRQSETGATSRRQSEAGEAAGPSRPGAASLSSKAFMFMSRSAKTMRIAPEPAQAFVPQPVQAPMPEAVARPAVAAGHIPPIQVQPAAAQLKGRSTRRMTETMAMVEEEEL